MIVSKDHPAPAGATKEFVVSVSAALGASKPVLPGESPEAYQRGLEATVLELGAVTPMQVYLAEKIYDTVWWIRRHEHQKRIVVLREMARILSGKHVLPLGRLEQQEPLSELESVALEAMLANQFDDAGLRHLVPDTNHTVESLLQEASQRKAARLGGLEKQIALMGKTLCGLQASFEALVNRGRNIERIELQNALMRRDLGAIDVGAIKVGAAHGNEPKKTKR